MSLRLLIISRTHSGKTTNIIQFIGKPLLSKILAIPLHNVCSYQYVLPPRLLGSMWGIVGFDIWIPGANPVSKSPLLPYHDMRRRFDEYTQLSFSVIDKFDIRFRSRWYTQVLISTPPILTQVTNNPQFNFVGFIFIFLYCIFHCKDPLPSICGRTGESTGSSMVSN